MPCRFLLYFPFTFMLSLVALGGDEDPKENIFKARAAYTAEIAKLRSEVIAGFDKREEKARNARNKKLVDEIKFQRAVFDEDEQWPADMTVELRMRLTKARTQVEGAYLSAIKEYTRAKKDEEAAATEKDLAEFRKAAFWPLLDLSKIEVKDGYFRIPSNSQVTTNKPWKGGWKSCSLRKPKAKVYGFTHVEGEL